ncbi:hypothetical protein AVEN_170556-1, partial [Araneus ventricosus]
VCKINFMEDDAGKNPAALVKEWDE